MTFFSFSCAGWHAYFWIAFVPFFVSNLNITLLSDFVTNSHLHFIAFNLLCLQNQHSFHSPLIILQWNDATLNPEHWYLYNSIRSVLISIRYWLLKAEADFTCSYQVFGKKEGCLEVLWAWHLHSLMSIGLHVKPWLILVFVIVTTGSPLDSVLHCWSISLWHERWS